MKNIGTRMVRGKIERGEFKAKTFSIEFRDSPITTKVFFGNEDVSDRVVSVKIEGKAGDRNFSILLGLMDPMMDHVGDPK